MESRGGGQAVPGAPEVGVTDGGVTTGGHLVSGQQLVRPGVRVISHHQMSRESHSLGDAGPEVGVGAGELVLLEAEAAAVAGQGQPPVLPVGAGHVTRHVSRAARVAVNLGQRAELIRSRLSKLWGLVPKYKGYCSTLRVVSLFVSVMNLPDMTSCRGWNKKLWRNI